MNKTFVIFRSPGPAWVAGTPTREQPLWNEHATFMDNLFEAGYVLMAGPYSDYSGVLLIIQAEQIETVKHLFDDDPWTREGILDVGEVKEWAIFLDGRQKT